MTARAMMKSYEVVSISDGSFAVVIRSDHELPQTVESFSSAEAARNWIDHQPKPPVDQDAVNRPADPKS